MVRHFKHIAWVLQDVHFRRMFYMTVRHSPYLFPWKKQHPKNGKDKKMQKEKKKHAAKEMTQN